MVKLSLISDTSDGKLWQFRHGFQLDWPTAILVKLIYPIDWNREWAKVVGRYYLSIEAVAPEAVGDRCYDAASSCGYTREDFDGLPFLAKCEVLADYGTKATLWQDGGNNLGKLMKACRAELSMYWLTYGFRMDRPENAIGQTGWDFIKGDYGYSTRKEVG